MLWHVMHFEVYQSSWTERCKTVRVIAILLQISKPPEGVSQAVYFCSLAFQQVNRNFQCSGVVCGLPRELGTCANSVYQALFPPPPHESLRMRLVSRGSYTFHVEAFALPRERKGPSHCNHQVVTTAENCCDQWDPLRRLQPLSWRRHM